MTTTPNLEQEIKHLELKLDAWRKLFIKVHYEASRLADTIADAEKKLSEMRVMLSNNH